MPSTPFGEQLKREREMRGVSLEEISAATRISTRFLEALENEQWDRLPGGVFNRGFIRSVARFLGLDGDTLISEYELERKTSPETHAAVDAPEDIPRNWRPAAAALALLAVLLAGGWFAYQRYALDISARIHRHTAAVASAPNPSLAGPAQATAEPSPSSAAPSSASPDSGAALAAVPLDLKIQAGKAADVKVIADGNIVFEGHLDVDAAKRFTARDTLEITASESSALLLELNGQTVPPIGTPGQPGSITLTRKDLKPGAGVAH